jgi:hypothetical protein
MHKKLFSKKLKEGDPSGDLGVEGRIILKFILRK